MSARRELLGRQTELDLITSSLVKAPPRSCVLFGGPGVGKTALAGACAELLETAGLEALRCTGTRSAAVLQLGAVASLLVDGEGELAPLLHRSAAALAERHRKGGLLVVIDDAHLLDDLSAVFVHQLALTHACPLIVTIQPGLSAPDAIAAISTDGLTTRVEVRPLDEEQSSELVGRILGGEVHGALLREVWHRCHGNPLATTELTRSTLESGAVVMREGLWCEARPLPPPSTLAAAARAHVSVLPDAVHGLLDVLAIADRVGLDESVKAFGRDVVETADELGHIVVTRDGERTDVRICQPVMAEAVAAQLTLGRRRRANERIYDILSSQPLDRRGDAERLALASLEIDRRPSDEVLVAAALDALHRSDLALRERFLRVRAQGGGVDETIDWADSLFVLGKHEMADEVLSTISFGPDDALSVAWLRSHNLSFALGRVDDALQVIASCRAVDANSAPHYDVLDAIALTSRGHTRSAAEIARNVTEQPDLTALVRAQAWWVLGFDAAIRGSITDALRAADAEAAATVEHLGSVEGRDVHSRSYFACSLAHAETGDLESAALLAHRGLELGLDNRSAEQQAMFRLALGRIALLRGDPATAAVMFRHGLVDADRTHDNPALRWHLAGLALALAEQGDPGGAGAALDRMEALDVGQFGLLEDDLPTRASAALALRRGERGAALALLDDGAERAHDQQAWVFESALLHEMARLDPSPGVAARLGRLVDVVDGPLVVERHRHALALERRDTEQLGHAAISFLGLGYRSFAVAAAEVAAQWLRQAGRHSRADRLCAQVGIDLETAPSATDGPTAIDLTSHEREIAVLAASGLSSREIADRLVLSIRTVDNHLQRIYMKLGIRRRADLAVYLTPLPVS